MSYTLIQQFNPRHAHISFSGQFLGNTVCWDTHLFTVMEYASHHGYPSGTARQFIDIEDTGSDTMKLVVVLNVPEINPPTIQKMMIMIRQYKKLSAGRHEYGDDIQLAQQEDNNN